MEHQFYLGKGLDSKVFHYRNLVYKFYCVQPQIHRVSFSEVNEYKALTNLISILYKDGIDLNTNEGKVVKVKFNTINSLFYLSCPVTVSNYVPGPQCNYPEEVWRSVRELGAEIGKELGVKGISLAQMNSKNTGNESIVITDICTHVKSLRRT